MPTPAAAPPPRCPLPPYFAYCAGEKVQPPAALRRKDTVAPGWL